MLCTVLILVLLTASIMVGLQLCNKTFDSTVTHSESSILAESLNALICDELRYATKIKTSGGKLTSYSSPSKGSNANITIGSDGHVLVKGTPILGKSAYVRDAKIKNLSILYDKPKKMFTVSYEIYCENYKGEQIVVENEFYQVLVLDKRG